MKNLIWGLVILAAVLGFSALRTATLLAQVAVPQTVSTQAIGSGSPATQVDHVALPSFEVASIKPHVPDNGPGMRVMMGGPEVNYFRASNVTAKMLIATAYNIKEFQISGGPSWVSSERFDLDAKVDDAEEEQLRKLPREQQQSQKALMLRSLLADRFKLQVTQSKKDGAVFALVVAKGGPKLVEVPQPDSQAVPASPANSTTPSQPPKPLPGQSFMMVRNGLMILTANAQPVSNLVNLLSLQLARPVIDRTGLNGSYEYTLQFAPEIGIEGLPPAPPASDEGARDSNTASLFTALQEQLGLKLESTNAPIDTITIDHIDKPSDN